jgi:site-specific DNA-methyltransferase (cytosine-N4-specific)
MKAVGRKSWKGSEFHTGKTGEHQLGRSQQDRKFDPGAGNKNNPSFDDAMAIMPEKRNKRDVWTVSTQGYKGAHFATFPSKLIQSCILAGCPKGGIVLDPFGGSGTTGAVAKELGRKSVLIELNPEYLKLIEERLGKQEVLAL